MSMVTEIAYGTPFSSVGAKTVALAIDGVEVRVPEGTYPVLRAAMEVAHQNPETLRHPTCLDSIRLLPALPRRDQGPCRDAGFLSDTGRAPGMIVYTQTERLKALCKGKWSFAVSNHPLGLPHLRRQWQLRIADGGMQRRAARCALPVITAPTTSCRQEECRELRRGR